MKKKITLTVLGLSLATSLVVGNTVFAEKANNNDSHMMNSDSMSTMMEDSNMSKMMDAMNSPEGKEMIKSCHGFMESYQDKEGQSDSKDNDLKTKETSL